MSKVKQPSSHRPKRTLSMTRAILALTLAVCFPLAAQSHEFWIEPERYEVSPTEAIIARLKVGQNLKGIRQFYNPKNFVRFEVIDDTGAAPVDMVLGDDPPLDQKAQTEGLAIVVHETTDSALTYNDREKFEAFVTHKDLQGVLSAHAARGLPETGFVEAYRRFAKALVAVGTGEGSDQIVGLRTEIVALRNPFTDDLSGGLPLQVLFEGIPRVNAQVELFEKAPDGTVEVTLHRTDTAGIALVPAKPGHEYLADAVIMEALEPDTDDGPVWRSLWAALTFAVPAQ